MRFNAPVVTAEFAEIAREIGVSHESNSEAESAEAFIEAIERLFAAIGIPRTIDSIGVTVDDFESIASLSMNATRLVENNPRPLSSEIVRSILGAAMAGVDQTMESKA